MRSSSFPKNYSKQEYNEWVVEQQKAAYAASIINFKQTKNQYPFTIQYSFHELRAIQLKQQQQQQQQLKQQKLQEQKQQEQILKEQRLQQQRLKDKILQEQLEQQQQKYLQQQLQKQENLIGSKVKSAKQVAEGGQGQQGVFNQQLAFNQNQTTQLVSDISQGKGQNITSTLSQKEADKAYKESVNQEVKAASNILYKKKITESKVAEQKLLIEWENSDNNYHIIEFQWYQIYQRWLNDPTNLTQFHSPIPNTKLFDKVMVQSWLEKDKDYKQVSTKIYLLMLQLYGGGPDIPLWMLSNNSNTSTISSVVDQAANWKNGIQEQNQYTKEKESASPNTTSNTMTSNSQVSYQQNPLPKLNVLPYNQVILTHPSKNEKQLMLQPKGLSNGYFFCYLNATIQAMLSVPEFNAYFYNPNNYSKDKSKKFVNIFFDLIKLYRESPYQVVDLKNLKNTIKYQFPSERQHDAQEFLRYLLCGIQDELNPQIDLKSSSEFKNSEEAYEYFLYTQTSIVDVLYAGQLVNNVYCYNCRVDATTYDPFFDLSLTVKEGLKNQTLHDCLARFFQDEEISNEYFCSKCRQFSRAKKQVRITKTPYILAMHLKRFKGYQMKIKLLDKVSFPLNNLSLNNCLGYSNCGSANYNLIAMIVHSGTLDSGHYYSYVRRGSYWFICNDSMCQEVSENQVMNSEAYMLFYQRIDEEQSSQTTSFSSNQNKKQCCKLF